MTEIYQIGPFRLDAGAPALTLDGEPVALGRRASAVLAVLVQRAHEYVPKDRIMEAVWPGVVVEDANLAVQISAIRRVLARAPGGDRWLETLVRRGYRFVGPVSKAAHAVAQDAHDALPRSGKLPEPLTSFIGRERELAELTTLLSRARLLTLVGAGGIGKTRLALRLAADVSGAFRDGVWLVELAALSDPRLVPQTVALALGLREAPGRGLTRSIVEHLASSQCLLVLDNAEHLLAASAVLADAILRQCPQVALIVTSRERLKTEGELTYRVPSLAMPDPTADAAPESLSTCESVRLFVERARLHLPRFALTGDNAPAVASICRRLDGIPLAIELAAARVRSMSVEEVNARLDQRFRVLTGGSTTALPRQQTLRSLIDWSYDLLDAKERALLHRLAVFAGGWSLEAAERICTGAPIEEWEIVDLLASLVDKNLAAAEERGGATRFRLLETVRQYARDRLRESGEEAGWHTRHFEFFSRLAADAEPQLSGPDQQRWLDRLDLEHDNLRTALAWSAGRDGEGGLRMAGALWRFWYVRGLLEEGRSCLAQALAAPATAQSAAARAKALNGAGGLARRQGDYPAARELHEASLALQRELGDERGIATALNSLGIVAREQGDYRVARARYEESLALRRKLDDPWGIAVSLNNLGIVVQHDGDLTAARALHDESLAIFRKAGDKQGIAYALSNLGLVTYRQGDHAAARALYEESLATFRSLGDRWGIAWSLEGLANVALALVGPGSAARIWGAAQQLRDRIGCPLPPSERPDYDRQLAAARVAMGDDAAFELAWNEGRSMTLEQALHCALAPEETP